MRNFIFTISFAFTISMIFTACKKEETKGNDTPSSNTNQPDENENYFSFKKNGIFYEMDKIMLGSSSNGYLGSINIGPNNNCTGFTSGSLPKTTVEIMLSDSISQMPGEFEISASNGVGISYMFEENDPNSTFNKKTYYNTNQHGTLILEKSLTGMTTKGTFEFVGYTSDGTDSIIVTEGKFNYSVPGYN